MIDEIKQTITQALPDSIVQILDPRNDGVHLEAIVISDLFIGKSLVEQHRIVMQPLKEHFQNSLHALGLKTYTQDEWKHKQEIK